MKIQPCAEKLQSETAFTVLARAQALERAGKDIVHLEIGQPDFPTPAHIRDAAIEALRQGKTGYGPAPGIPELRAAIARTAGEQRGLSFQPEQVIVTPGGKPVILYTVQSLAGPGDEVVYPDPGFPMYESLIRHSGATPVPLPLLESRDFRFDPDEFRRRVSSKTSLLIINSPHNPTGGALTASDFDVIAEAAKKYDFAVLADEIYKDYLYDDVPFQSITRAPGMAERTVILDGFSKSYSMTGWRVGFGIVPEPLAETFELYNVNIASCTCTFNQYGALAALQGPQDCVREMVAEFRQRRDFLTDGVNRIKGLSCRKPAGAFYAFVNITKTGRSASRLEEELLEGPGLATLAGDAFGAHGAGFLRLSYATSMEKLAIALDRLKDYLGSGTNTGDTTR